MKSHWPNDRNVMTVTLCSSVAPNSYMDYWPHNEIESWLLVGERSFAEFAGSNDLNSKAKCGS